MRTYTIILEALTTISMELVTTDDGQKRTNTHTHTKRYRHVPEDRRDDNGCVASTRSNLDPTMTRPDPD